MGLFSGQTHAPGYFSNLILFCFFNFIFGHLQQNGCGRSDSDVMSCALFAGMCGYRPEEAFTVYNYVNLIMRANANINLMVIGYF